MKRFLAIFFVSIVAFIFGWFSYKFLNSSQVTNISKVVEEKEIEKPLEKYTIENLSQAKIEPGKIEITDIISEKDAFTSYLFKFTFDHTLQGGSLQGVKTTTGQINFPNATEGAKPSSIILMLRGYVDQELYKTGDGTRRAAEVFAQNGFITIAPDFLGYAGSSEEAANIFESRFQTYTTVLSLLKTLEELKTDLTKLPNNITIKQFNNSAIFIWAHSNGGQIALTALEISQKEIPTTLWAPVTENFPYNILYYTNEAEDRGKLIRSELAKFEQIYDVEKYAVSNYFDRLNCPLQIHQGTQDDAIPLEWTYRFLNHLKALEKDYTYYEYSGADHNLLPNWNTVIERDLEFFNSHIE